MQKNADGIFKNQDELLLKNLELDRKFTSICRVVIGKSSHQIADGKLYTYSDPSTQSAAVMFPEKPSEAITPNIGREIGNQATICFLKAKTKVLEEELTTLKNDFKRQTAELQKTQSILQKSEDQRYRWHQQAKQAQSQLERQEKVASEAIKKYVNKESEASALRKDMGNLKKELNGRITLQKSNEKLLNRTLEDIEKLKSALKKAELEEKERVGFHKKKHEEMIATIKKLEAQKQDLITFFKKQMHIIENLKRQKNDRETTYLLELTEEQFSKLLNWIPEKRQEVLKKHTY